MAMTSTMSEVEVSGHGDAAVIGAGARDVESEQHRAELGQEYDEEAKQEHLSDQERKLALWLAVMSAFDVVISGIMIAVAFLHAYRDNGVSLYCLGIQAFSHLISSALLTLRFASEYRTPKDAPAGYERGLLTQRRREFLVREQTMSVIMGIVMLISSAALLFKAFRKIKFWNRWYYDHYNMDQDVANATRFLAWYGVVVYSGQALVRLVVGMKLRRVAVWHAFVASCVSLVFLLVLAVAATEMKEWSWKAEPIAAILLSFVTLAEGIRIIYFHFDDVDMRLQTDNKA
mmetsp:Transcript_20568/g.34089  ORF Transcript_20568/g.34089 Transcript_20568/m.34089 type:complete len:288 (-) Transcript_20568:111-974(-)